MQVDSRPPSLTQRTITGIRRGHRTRKPTERFNISQGRPTQRQIREQNLKRDLSRAAESTFHVHNHTVYRVVFDQGSRPDHRAHVHTLLTSLKVYLGTYKTCKGICQIGGTGVDWDTYLLPHFQSIITVVEEASVEKPTVESVSVGEDTHQGEIEKEDEEQEHNVQHLMYFAIPNTKERLECSIQGLAMNRIYKDPSKVEGFEGFGAKMLYCDVICAKSLGESIMCDMRNQCFLKQVNHITLRALIHVVPYYYFQYGFYVYNATKQRDTANKSYKEEAAKYIRATERSLKRKSNANLKSFRKNIGDLQLPRQTLFDDLKLLHAPRHNQRVEPSFIDAYTDNVIQKVMGWDDVTVNAGIPMAVNLALPTRRIGV